MKSKLRKYIFWKIKSLNGSMILFFRYKLHVYDISIYFQGHWNNFIFRFLILLHNCLHFLENIFDLWFEIQTDGGKNPALSCYSPLSLLLAVFYNANTAIW